MHDDIVALLPVDRRGNTVLVSDLERVDYSDNLVEIPTGACRVGDCETDDLLWVNHEDSADLTGKDIG